MPQSEILQYEEIDSSKSVQISHGKLPQAMVFFTSVYTQFYNGNGRLLCYYEHSGIPHVSRAQAMSLSYESPANDGNTAYLSLYNKNNVTYQATPNAVGNDKNLYLEYRLIAGHEHHRGFLAQNILLAPDTNANYVLTFYRQKSLFRTPYSYSYLTDKPDFWETVYMDNADWIQEISIGLITSY